MKRKKCSWGTGRMGLYSAVVAAKDQMLFGRLVLTGQSPGEELIPPGFGFRRRYVPAPPKHRMGGVLSLHLGGSLVQTYTKARTKSV